MIPNDARDFNFDLGETADAICATRCAASRRTRSRRAPPRSTGRNKFPRDLWPQMGELGLHGITVEEEYGGSGSAISSMSSPWRRCRRASASVGLSYGAHSNLCVNQIRRNGNDGAEAPLPAQADLRRACRRARHVGAGRGLRRRLDEAPGREAGRPLRPQRHQVVDHQRPVADTLVVYAKTDPAAGPRGITAFLIEKGLKGFSTAQKLDKLGMRGSDTGELVFEDCEVPDENVLGEVGKRRRRADVAASTTSARAGGRAARHHAGLPGRGAALRPRAQAVRPADRLVPADAGQARRHVRHAERRPAYVYAVAKACDRGETTRYDAAGAILFAAEKATQCALDAIQPLGGNVIARSLLCSVNLTEVVSKLIERGATAPAALEVARGLPYEIVPYDEDFASDAGVLWQTPA